MMILAAWELPGVPNKKDTVSGVSFVMHRIWKFICQPQFPLGNPPDFFPLWFAAREDNTLSSRLTRFTTDLAVFLMGNPTDFLSIMTYSPRKQYFVSAPSISAFVSLTSVLAWEQRQCLVVAGYHSTESKSEWISYKW